MFNFFRRKKSPGEEKKKRGSQKDRSSQKKVDGREEEGSAGGGKFATPQSSPAARREAIAARSDVDKERTGGSQVVGPPLPPKPTFRTGGTGVVPNPSVVGPPSPSPTVVMGNDYSQPLNTSPDIQGIHDIPFADCTEKNFEDLDVISAPQDVKPICFLQDQFENSPEDVKKENSDSAFSLKGDKSETSVVVNSVNSVLEKEISSKNLHNLVDKSVLENKSSEVNFEDNLSLVSAVKDNLVVSAFKTLDTSSTGDHVDNKSSLEATAKNKQQVINSESDNDSILRDNDTKNLCNGSINAQLFIKNDSEFENNLKSDEPSLTNETKEEKSVTGNVGDYVLDLARRGPVASCKEYSSGNIPGSESNATQARSIDVPPPPDEEMHRVRSFTQCVDRADGFNCADMFDQLKKGVSGNVCDVESNGPLTKSVDGPGVLHPSESCDDASKSDSDETSEDESSECEDSDSDNVIKNDSGCWDERDSSLFLSESDNQVTTTASLSSVSSILRDGKHREKKHVKWADIDGKKDLTYEKENTDTFVEGSSSEEEEDDSEEEDAESEEDNESEETDSEEGKDGVDNTEANETSVQPLNENDYKREDTWLDMKSSSSESEEDDEEEDISKKQVEEANIQVIEKTTDDAGESEESTESEEETTEDESSEDEQVKNEEPKALRIDIAEMHNRIAELQKDVNIKTTNIDRLQVELDAACNESELVRQRFKRLEADLESYKQANKELLQRIQVTEHIEEEKVSKSNKQLEAAEKRIQDIERELEKVKLEYNNLQTSYKKLHADRDMEVQIIQKALEKALTDQEEMEAKYEKEFEKLRTLNSSREVQMLDDFEWKLREVERNCKKKMHDFENEYEKKSLDLASQLAAAQADLEQISHLKLCEIELNQLKQTSSEQWKNLRTANRKLEELQVSEKILQEEVNSLRSSLDKEKAHIVALQTMHKEELAEKDRKLKFKLEFQIKQLTNEWEERLRKENNKIKTDLERIAREEKIVAVDIANKSKDKEIAQLKQNWEKRAQEFKNEIEKYKSKISSIEDQRRTDLDNAQTNADRDVFELRRKIDKLDMSYQEKIEKIQEQHEAEIAALKEDCDKRVQQSESNLQFQIGNSRTTLELVKQQLRNEAQAKMERLENEYKQKLEQQWATLTKEKDAALALLEEKHQKALETIYKEIEKTKKQARNEQDSLTRKRNQPPPNQPIRQVAAQQNRKQEIENEHSQNSISTRLDVAEVAEEIRIQGKEEVLQRSIEQLTRQLNAGKMEIEKLRQQLEAREARQQQQHNQQQQRNSQQPVPNPRRNRKGRSGRN